jgi:hypothetical protein
MKRVSSLKADLGAVLLLLLGAAAEPRIPADLSDKLDSWYGAVGAAEIPPAQDLSPESEEQLRSLGYIR